MAIRTEVEWMQLGNCRGSDVDFHPTDGWGVRLAQDVCHGCPVKGLCRDFALDTRQDHGVWGGTSERERRRLQRIRRRNRV